MMSSKAPPIASVKISEPATNATPSTIANALRSSRSLRATRLRQVTLSIAQAPRPPAELAKLRHPLEHPLGRRVAHLVDDLAVGEEDHAVGVAGGDRVVGHHDDGLAELVDRALAAAASTSAPERGVEVAGGLVGEDDRRAGWPARGPPRPAAAGRPRARWAGGSSRSPSPTVSMTSVVPLLVRLAAGDRQRQQDVLLRGQRRHQVERLEDEADPVAAQPGQRLVVERDEVGVAEQHRAAGGVVERRAAVHQRRLARARGAHHRGELAGVEVEGHAVERAHLGLAGAVDLGQVGDPGGDAVRRRAWGRVVCSVTSSSSSAGPPRASLRTSRRHVERTDWHRQRSTGFRPR